MAKRQRTARVDRLLAFLDADDPTAELPKARAFQRIFVLILCVEYWARATPHGNDLGLSNGVGLPLVTVAAAVALTDRWDRWGFAALALLQARRLWIDFPGAGNHSYLELILCVLCAAFDVRQREDRMLVLRAVRWMTCVVFFFAGVQKLVHGYYFHGQALAYSIQIDAFRPVLRLLLPPAEYVRLSGYHGQAGEGPYRLSEPLLVLASNATYVTELILAALLAMRPTRVLAVIVSLLFLVTIETAAREFFFGLIFSNMLLLFLPTALNRRLLSVYAAVLVCLLLSRLQILPQMIFY